MSWGGLTAWLTPELASLPVAPPNAKDDLGLAAAPANMWAHLVIDMCHSYKYRYTYKCPLLKDTYVKA